MARSGTRKSLSLISFGNVSAIVLFFGSTGVSGTPDFGFSRG
ncbi:MAG TPA: hypothetical protein VF490_05695 [Chryseosolibacter sp.]